MERENLLNNLILDDSVHSREVVGIEYCEKICLPNKPKDWKCSYFLGERNCKEIELFVDDYYRLKNH
jgi:hypothetical protein